MKKNILSFVLIVLTLISAVMPVSAADEEKTLAISEAKASFADLYEAINPSVVYIEVAKPEKQDDSSSIEYSPFDFDWGEIFGPEFQKFFEQGQPEEEEPENEGKGKSVVYGSGTGFVWDTEGHIVTNNHVIEDAETVTITYFDGIVRDAEVIGADPDSDLAVLYVENFRTDIAPVVMGDSSAVKPGDLVCAIGNPLGQTGTMTQGIVSALNRSFTVDSGDSNGNYTIPNMIQTDASINPGNSGGVLIDLDGEVIGVVNSFSSYSYSSAGIGYAIPGNLASRVVPSMIETGTYAHPWIGISGIALTPAVNEALELDHDQRGAYIQTVTEGGPAEAAGILAGTEDFELESGLKIKVGGDIVTRINDREVKTMDDIISYLSTDTSAGDVITLHVIRDGEEKNIDLTLSARPTAAERMAAQKAEAEKETPEQGTASLGAYISDLTPQILDLMELPEDTEGVLISGVIAESPAEDAGLIGCTLSEKVNGKSVDYGGDIVTMIDEEAVTSAAELKAAIVAHLPGERVVLTVIRDGETIEVPVRLGNSLSR